jgi:hypothetical protein
LQTLPCRNSLQTNGEFLALWTLLVHVCTLCKQVTSTKAKTHMNITGLHDVRYAQSETNLKPVVIEWLESLLRVGMRKDAVLKLNTDFNAQQVRPKKSEQQLLQTKIDKYREQLRSQVR